MVAEYHVHLSLKYGLDNHWTNENIALKDMASPSAQWKLTSVDTVFHLLPV